MELDEGERAELTRLRTEVCVLREANRFYKDFITAQAKMSFSAVALPIDLPDEGEQNFAPILVDLARAEQVRFEGAGG